MIRTPTFCVGDRVLAPACRADSICGCGNPGGPGTVTGDLHEAMGLYWVELDADPADDDGDTPPRLFRAVDLRREPTV